MIIHHFESEMIKQVSLGSCFCGPINEHVRSSWLVILTLPLNLCGCVNACVNVVVLVRAYVVSKHNRLSGISVKSVNITHYNLDHEEINAYVMCYQRIPCMFMHCFRSRVLSNNFTPKEMLQ